MRPLVLWTVEMDCASFKNWPVVRHCLHDISMLFVLGRETCCETSSQKSVILITTLCNAHNNTCELAEKLDEDARP